MTEQPKTQENNQEASFHALMTAWIISKNLRNRMASTDIWNSDKQTKVDDLSAKIAREQHYLHQLKNLKDS